MVIPSISAKVIKILVFKFLVAKIFPCQGKITVFPPFALSGLDFPNKEEELPCLFSNRNSRQHFGFPPAVVTPFTRERSSFPGLFQRQRKRGFNQQSHKSMRTAGLFIANSRTVFDKKSKSSHTFAKPSPPPNGNQVKNRIPNRQKAIGQLFARSRRKEQERETFLLEKAPL